MAYKNRKNDKISSFKLINEKIKEDTLPNVLLLCGKEQFLVNWTLNSLKKKYINKSTEALDYCFIDGNNASYDKIVEACDTLSMFSLRRIVEVRDFPLLMGKSLKGFNSENENQLCEYIKMMPKETLLVFSCENPDMRLKLCRTISSLGGVFDFDTLGQKDLENFIIKNFKSAKKYCKGLVIEEIINMSGYYHQEAKYTLYNLENDLKKIIAHSTQEEIFLSDVISTISGNLETNSFAMVDALSRGKKDEAYRILFNINPTREDLIGLLGLTISQFELILKVKELSEEGKNQDSITNILAVHPFRVKKALEFSKYCNRQFFKSILLMAYKVDADIKNGLLDDRLSFELFIAMA